MSETLTKDEIAKKAAEFKLSPEEVEKDYIQSWVIREIFRNEYLAPLVTLKGSGALRKLYYPDTRFAGDLDFSAFNHIDQAILEDQLQKIGREVEKNSGIKFTEEIKLGPKKLPQEMNVDALEARLYFKGIYSDGKLKLKTQVDVTLNDKYHLPAQHLPIIHPYFDAQALVGEPIRAQKVEDIIASKFITLIHRRKPGDFFDLINSVFLSNQLQISKREILSALLAKTNFSLNSDELKSFFSNIPFEQKYEQTWSGLIVPASSKIPFERARSSFLSSIGAFFDDAVSEVSAFSYRAFGIGNYRLSNELRERVINAGQRRHLLRIGYTGVERIVEPYRLEFYTRERDRQTHEYLWVYDRSGGGKSGKTGTKMWFTEKIESIEEVLETFVPQWEVEF